MVFNLKFNSVAEKSAFGCRLEDIQFLLAPPGGGKLDNLGFMTAMFDIFERDTSLIVGEGDRDSDVSTTLYSTATVVCCSVTV